MHTHGRLKHSPGIQATGDTLSFKGPGTSAARIEEPLSPILNYFELEILNKGAESSIGIGAGLLSYPLNRMPGWNRSSVGYHADDGRLYQENGRGSDFGPKCSDGDRMGCGVDFSLCEGGSGYVDVFFTKNDKQVGHKVRIKCPVHGLYPLIGLHSNNEKIRYLGHWHRDPDSLLEPMVQDHTPSSTWLRSNGVKFVDDGLTLEYTGDSSHAQDVGIAQSRHRLDRTHHYFEMEILSVGLKGALAIGLAKNTYPLHVHPGWNPGAIGYHADDGKVFIERGFGEEFGPTCGVGDRMGCGIRYDVDGDGVSDVESDESEEEGAVETENVDPKDYIQQAMAAYRRGEDIRQLRALVRSRSRIPRPPQPTAATSSTKCTVYFTKNSELVGEREVYVPKGGFYPVVAMLSHGEKLRVNWEPLTG